MESEQPRFVIKIEGNTHYCGLSDYLAWEAIKVNKEIAGALGDIKELLTVAPILRVAAQTPGGIVPPGRIKL